MEKFVSKDNLQYNIQKTKDYVGSRLASKQDTLISGENIKTINKYTKIATIILALIEAIGIYLGYSSSGIFINDFGIIICEIPLGAEIIEEVNGFSLKRRYRYGKTELALFRKQEAETEIY